MHFCCSLPSCNIYYRILTVSYIYYHLIVDFSCCSLFIAYLFYYSQTAIIQDKLLPCYNCYLGAIIIVYWKNPFLCWGTFVHFCYTMVFMLVPHITNLLCICYTWTMNNCSLQFCPLIIIYYFQSFTGLACHNLSYHIYVTWIIFTLGRFITHFIILYALCIIFTAIMDWQLKYFLLLLLI